MEKRTHTERDMAGDTAVHADHGQRRGVGRFWTKVLILSTLLTMAGAIIYDLYPSLVLPYRVDSFLEVVEMGAQRRLVEAGLKDKGFEVPESTDFTGELTAIYVIRTREPYLERIADAIALSLGRDAWWDSKKYPHHAYVGYDTSGTIYRLELDSQFNPLWY